jgi:cell division septation protein DedD
VISTTDKNGNEFSSGDMIESDYTYNIIVGVFSRIEYAEGLVQNLKKKGFDAKLIGKRNGLHVVSAGASNRIAEAKQLLEKARGEVQSAWILNSKKN